MKPIIIASYGGSGSTFICDIIKKYLVFRLFEKNPLYKAKKSGVYMTHCFSSKIPHKAKVLFIFSNPYNAVLSVHKREDFTTKLHYEHLNAEDNFGKDFQKFDVLRLEEHFDSYYKPQSFELATVKYEDLHLCTKEISDFLGIVDMEWPEILPRKTDWTIENPSEEFINTYSSLYNKWLNAESFKIWS